MHGLTMTEVLEVLALRPGEGVNLTTADGRLFLIEWMGGDWFLIDDVVAETIQPLRTDDIDAIFQTHGGIVDLLNVFLQDDWATLLQPCIMVLSDEHAS